jgi:hypothetical protein
MKSQVCFNTDRVTVIYLYKEKPGEFKFYPAVPSRQKYICRWLDQIYPFRAIPFGMTEAREARWSKSDPKYSYDLDEYMCKQVMYKIIGEGDDRTIVQKACAIVYLGHNENIKLYFDSDQEAEEFINSTKTLTKNLIQTVFLG